MSDFDPSLARAISEPVGRQHAVVKEGQHMFIHDRDTLSLGTSTGRSSPYHRFARFERGADWNTGRWVRAHGSSVSPGSGLPCDRLLGSRVQKGPRTGMGSQWVAFAVGTSECLGAAAWSCCVTPWSCWVRLSHYDVEKRRWAARGGDHGRQHEL